MATLSWKQNNWSKEKLKMILLCRKYSLKYILSVMNVETNIGWPAMC